MEALKTIAQGTLRGTTSDGVSRFLGIPYAAAPVGDLRFQVPAPAPAWSGVRDATSFGPTAPKPGYAPPFDGLLPEPAIAGPDCLNLNVWAPDQASGAPVMVWIHGGAFVNGSSAVPVYDGATFARDGIVFVSLNYRLGPIGFAYLPDAPANRGLLDQVAALEWVQRNIEAFGGDPTNVTIFGESAGGMSVTLLLSSPRTAGLFSKAIAQSGAIQAAAAPSDAALVTADFAARLGVEPTAAGLAAVDTATIVATATEFGAEFTAGLDPQRWGATVVSSAMPFIPVVDGDLLTEHPVAAFFGATNSGIPLVTGTNLDEENFFLIPTGITGFITDEIAPALAARTGAGPDVFKLYQANRPDATAGTVYSAFLTDAYFRLPALAVADARRAAGERTWVYEFAQPDSRLGMGACHGLEVGYVFDNLYADGNDMLSAVELTDPEVRRDLANAMHRTWMAFARTGDPGWPDYDESRPVMVYAGSGGTVVNDPRGDERAIWTA